MPPTLFEPIVRPAPKTRRPIGTVVVSVLLHAAALAIIGSLQIAAAVDLPGVQPHMLAYLPPPPSVPATPPPPRPASPATPSSTVTNTAPTVAPDAFTPEPAMSPPSGPPPVPTGTFTIGKVLPGSAIDQSGVTLADPPRPSGPMRIGGVLRAPARVVYVAPAYPLFARTARIEGDVVLDATIDEAGAVTNVTVRTSIGALDRAAVEAVSKWRYTPTRLNGVPVAIVMEVTVAFRLR